MGDFESVILICILVDSFHCFQFYTMCIKFIFLFGKNLFFFFFVWIIWYLYSFLYSFFILFGSFSKFLIYAFFCLIFRSGCSLTVGYTSIYKAKARIFCFCFLISTKARIFSLCAWEHLLFQYILHTSVES